MNIAQWLVRSSRLHPANPALMLGDEVLCDYAGFAANAAAIGFALRDRFSLLPGERVAIIAENSPAYLEALYGIWFAGLVAVPVNAKLHGLEAAWIIADAGARLVLVSGKTASALAPHLGDPSLVLMEFDSAEFASLKRGETLPEPVPRERSDMAWLFYTSGTTGNPKGVMITHANIQAMAFSYFADVDTVTEADAAFYAAPMSHGAGLYNVQHVLKAARHVTPPSRSFNPAEILDLSPTLTNVHMFAAPTMVRRLVDTARNREDPGHGIRTIVYGGGPMYEADIVEAVEVMGPRFCQIYGQGESPMTITALQREAICDRTHPRWRERIASVGTAQSCVEVAVFDQEGKALPASETGEVVVRGPTVMAGYWNNDKATRTAIRDGWLWTGDMGALDKDGFLTLKDRSKDLIISGGTNIYPREVEEALLTHSGVHEASVVGRSDPEWGEVVVAFVVAKPGFDVSSESLNAHCLERIARFKRPREYHFIAQLPKNNYGKVLKTELRTLLGSKNRS
ncbi:MAG: AMP-binding protein [Nitratireductor sp.]